MKTPLKVGDRVRVYAFNSPLAKHLGQTIMIGTIMRAADGRARVSIDGSESQDSEGHKAYDDFYIEQLRRLKPKRKAREWWLEYQDFPNGPLVWASKPTHARPVIHVREVLKK